MKIPMKIPITDKFLLDIIFPFLSVADDLIDFLLSNRYRQVSILLGNENPIIRKYKISKKNRQFDQVINYLKRNNYIKVENIKNKKAAIITKRGFDKALKASFKIEKKRKRKDGKWIIITFDIPQQRRKARNLLRSVLCNLGYKMFQQSVWVTPFDVLEKTERLLQKYSLDEYVKIFLTEEM